MYLSERATAGSKEIPDGAFISPVGNIGRLNTAVKRTAHEYKFELPVNYAFPVTF